MSPTTASHRVYLPPTSPLPRTSEDSVRSRESTTSTALSLFSDCTSTSAISKTSSTLQSISSGSDSIVRRNTRQDRALPYLPLRIKNLDEGRKTSDGQRDSSNLLTAADDVEQLVLTPSSPPESAKHIFNSLYPEAKSIHGHGDPQLSRCNRLKDTCPEDAYDVEETVDSIKSSTARRSLDKSPILASSSPGASQILSRNATHSINHSATVSKSPASPPAFVDVSPLKASQKLTGETHVLQTRPTRSSSLSNASCSGDMVQDAHKGPTGRARTPAVSSAFRALMLQPVPVFPTGLSDEEKLVNLHVGGSKVYTTRLSAITSHQDSNLAVFINTHLQTVGKAAGATSTEGENNEESVQTINDESNELRPSSEVKRDQPRMAEALSLPASVALHSPTSPIHAIRSARASIYDDILSDQGEEDEKNDIDISIPGTLQEPLFGICKSVDSFRGKLGVSPFSFPDPRKGGMRFTRFTTASSSSTSVSNMDGHATGPSSDCEGSTDSGRVSQGEGETLNFIDTTPDNEPDNPFHLQEEVTSAAPSVSSQQGRVIASKADKSKASLDTEESRYSSNSIPSLSSSNNSSDHSQIDSPILTSKSVAAPQLTGSSAFEQIVSQHQQYLWLPVNVYIDRSAQPYDGLLHWLRTGSLPSRLCLDEALSLATADGTAESHQSIRAVLDMIPTEAKQKLMPLVLHPIMSEVKDLRDEAEYLGFYKLVKQCEAEIAKLKRAIRFSRNVVGHPGMHVRSESEGGTAASPAKLTGRLANRPRPRLVGHRHYDSESKTMPREMKTQAQDNWI